MKASRDGLATEPYQVGVDGPALTLGGELNKLAHNLSFGRDMSGVHWRADDVQGNLQGTTSPSAFSARPDPPGAHDQVTGIPSGESPCPAGSTAAGAGSARPSGTGLVMDVSISIPVQGSRAG